MWERVLGFWGLGILCLFVGADLIHSHILSCSPHIDAPAKDQLRPFFRLGLRANVYADLVVLDFHGVHLHVPQRLGEGSEHRVFGIPFLNHPSLEVVGGARAGADNATVLQ